MSGVDTMMEQIVATIATDVELLGQGADVWIGDLPSDLSYPAVRMYPQGGQSVQTLRGESELRNMVWVVDSYAKTMIQAVRIGERIRTILSERFQATLPQAPFNDSEPDLHVHRYTFQASLWA